MVPDRVYGVIPEFSAAQLNPQQQRLNHPEMSREQCKPTTRSVYDASNGTWVGLDHGAPDDVLADVDLRTGSICPRSPTAMVMRAAIGEQRLHDVWKTLVRYVWHNARSVSEACVFFGIAALEADRGFLRRMRPDEVQAIRDGGGVNGSRASRVFHFKERMVYRAWEPLQGYTPLRALLDGEQGQWSRNATERGERRQQLAVLFRASWEDLRTHKFERSLRAAFANFTTQTAEDRGLVAEITQTEFAKAFDETRAAMCARRKRKVRVSLEANGYRPQPPPGGKGEVAIAKYSAVQMGNHNRSGSGGQQSGAGQCVDALDFDDAREVEAAVASLRDHTRFFELRNIPVRPDLPRDPRALRAHFNALADAAEERRLAALCGVAAGEIQLSKTKPTPHHEHKKQRAD